jgi:hypothetical protein
MNLDKQQQKEGERSSFHFFKAETMARREMDLEWSEKMKQKFKEKRRHEADYLNAGEEKLKTVHFSLKMKKIVH